ncbi:6023_t:CDS:2, partial [Racocetra persica]
SDPLTVSALKQFIDKKPHYVSKDCWIRDAALVAISSSKTDQFANGKFIPIEYVNTEVTVGAVGAIVKRIDLQLIALELVGQQLQWKQDSFLEGWILLFSDPLLIPYVFQLC